MAESKNSSRRVKAAERARKALDLKIAGATYQRIGDTLGMSRSGAAKAVERAMRDLREEVREAAAELREIESARLDRMLLGIWQKARSGDLAAIDRVLRIMERRARLYGLDGPIGLDHTTKGEALGSKVDVSKLTTEALQEILAASEAGGDADAD